MGWKYRYERNGNKSSFIYEEDDPIKDWGMPSDLFEQWQRQDKKKIRIAPGQPINTSVFQEAEVIEYLPHGY